SADRAGDVGLLGVARQIVQRIAAVERQANELEREQAGDREQHDRNQPHIAQRLGHAATEPTRSRRRSANERAAAATAFGSGSSTAAGITGTSSSLRDAVTMRTNRSMT